MTSDKNIKRQKAEGPERRWVSKAVTATNWKYSARMPE